MSTSYPLAARSANVVDSAQPMTARGAKAENMKLSADWQLSAALLSRPVDLSALVALSARSPEQFVETSMLHRLAQLLNSPNTAVSNKKCKIDILSIFANLSRHEEHREAVRGVIITISEWFEAYMDTEESCASVPEEVRSISDIEDPALFKQMLVTLARTYDYSLRSDDLLELTNNDTVLGLATVIGVLEDGIEEQTEVCKTRSAAVGQVAQWEQRTVTRCHEKPLVLQLCRLLRGFTLPATYFKAQGTDHPTADGEYSIPGLSGSSAISDAPADHAIDEFRSKINQLLAITLDSELVEKVTTALCEQVFPEQVESLQENGFKSDANDVSDDEDDTTPVLLHADHLSIISLQRFMHNLYFFANDVYLPLFRQHLLVESRVTPDMILPYLQVCLNLCIEAAQETDPRRRAEGVEEVVVDGISASLKTLVISTFRASPTSAAVRAFHALNPTATMIQCCWEVLHTHVGILALLLFFNININSLNITTVGVNSTDPIGTGSNSPHALLHCFAALFSGMERRSQKQLLRVLAGAAGLPVARDAPSYSVVWGMLTSIYSANLNADFDGKLVERVDGSDKASQPNSKTEAEVVVQNESRSLASQGEANWCPADAAPDDLVSDLVENSDAVQDTACQQANATVDPGTDNAAAAPEVVITPAAEESKEDGPSAISTSLDTKVGAKAVTQKSREHDTRFRLLGDLPSLVPGNAAFKGAKKKKDKKRVRKSPTKGSDTSGGGVPEMYKCAINGHLMRQPVRSPQGLVFERATLLEWHSTHGSVCPITGTPLDIASLEVDADLSNAIAKWHVARAMSNQNAFEIDPFASEALGIGSGGGDDDDDLYDF